MHIKGLGAEGGKTISSSVLEARQGSNIFSGWSHHFTVKDRCLVKAEPWQQEVTQRTAGWTFMLLINNSGTSFIHPHIDRQKKRVCKSASDHQSCRSLLEWSPGAACDYSIHRQDSCGALAGEKTGGPDGFGAGSHNNVFHKISSTKLQGIWSFLLFEGGQNVRPNLPETISVFPRQHCLHRILGELEKKEKKKKRVGEHRSITTCWRWDNPSAAP